MVLPPKEGYVLSWVSNLNSLQRRFDGRRPPSTSYKPEAESFPLQCPRGR